MAHSNDIYNALVKKYEADMADAEAKLNMFMYSSQLLPEHADITGEIDKLLHKYTECGEKLATLKRKYGKSN
tara:strand:- start:48 stop:263 length:216 start_codon:yes stop_codon:yes gene_type:complete